MLKNLLIALLFTLNASFSYAAIHKIGVTVERDPYGPSLRPRTPLILSEEEVSLVSLDDSHRFLAKMGSELPRGTLLYIHLAIPWDTDEDCYWVLKCSPHRVPYYKEGQRLKALIIKDCLEDGALPTVEAIYGRRRWF